MNLQQWMALTHQTHHTQQVQDFNAPKAVEAGMRHGVFWDEADCRTALNMLLWICRSQAASSLEIQTHWTKLLAQRRALLQAEQERGLRSGAFRHPFHARNALQKYRRTGERTSDFIQGWTREVNTRIEDALIKAA